jgi:hypothetical protein
MNTYEPDKLLSLWRRNEIDSEMAIGHILQNLVLLHEAIRQLNLLGRPTEAEHDRIVGPGRPQSI